MIVTARGVGGGQGYDTSCTTGKLTVKETYAYVVIIGV
jgi:hypothetical protein